MRNLTIAVLLTAFFLTLVIIASRIDSGTKPNEGRVEVTLQRIFGGCSDEYAGVTDLSKAVGECGVIQVLINKFNAENKAGAVVVTQSTQSGGYYDRLGAAFAARRPPDVAIMHLNMLPDFQQRGLLLPVGDLLSRAGVDWEDLVPSARASATFDDQIFALPFDLHVLLWHLNVEIFRKAGLVSADGLPRLPSSKDELLSHAEQVKQRTGKRYFTIPSIGDPMPVWTFETWVWQQGGELLFPDSLIATINSPEALKALTLLASLYERSYASRSEDYTAAEQTFLRGEAAVLVNGTWVVDSLLEQSKRSGTVLKEYSAHAPPKIFEREVNFGGSHLWVLPRPEKINEAKRRAAVEFLKFLYDENGAWARTGHLPVRQSVLQSAEFLNLPQRKNYSQAAMTARTFPHVERQTAIGHYLGQEINATWLIGRSPEESLLLAQEAIQGVLERVRATRAKSGSRR